ncbi:MAG: hypothetical protein KDK62_06880 [Chlamydiia bacterium]|nr:hypothetical protein [Chlamydiia bacterium]
MKDEAHHMKHVQKKIIQENRREQNHLKSKENESEQMTRKKQQQRV